MFQVNIVNLSVSDLFRGDSVGALKVIGSISVEGIPV